MLLDASALLAYLHQEPGGAVVKPMLPIAAISTVNWCEVVQKLWAKSIDDKAVAKKLKLLGLRFIPFTLEHADQAGELWQITSPLGLSLADRACLAVGLVEQMPIMTADKVWQELALDLKIQLIR